jgi:hypothetical protein
VSAPESLAQVADLYPHRLARLSFSYRMNQASIVRKYVGSVKNA